MVTRQLCSGGNGFKAAVMPACSCTESRQTNLPAGNCLSRTRARQLRESDWIVVSSADIPVGLAAYRHPDSEIRVVHELILDRTLTSADASRVTAELLAALELVAYEDGVQCLTFMLRCDFVSEPFEERGYTSLALDATGTWLQKKLGWLGWCEARSGRAH
jgi:hypothetical protein